MVYNIKMGIVAGAGIAGTAISTFSSKMGNGQSPSGGGCNDKNTNYGTNNGCSGSTSFGYTGSGGSRSANGNGSSSKNDDTFKQMHMWILATALVRVTAF